MAAAASAGVRAVGLTHAELDITSEGAVLTTMERLRPAVVVNSCSFTNVEQCEQNPAQAHAVNAEGAGNVARGAARVGARVIYISTDYVFDGTKPPAEDGVATPANSYLESDPIGPLNVYGASKAGGERATAAATPNHLIVRVSSLFGLAGSRGKGGNFIETIIRKAREGGPLRVVNDQWMTPTYAGDAAPVIIGLAGRTETGVIHVANGGVCTWHTLAIEALRLQQVAVPVDAASASNFASLAQRPRNSALNTELVGRLGAQLPSWQVAVRTYTSRRAGR